MIHTILSKPSVERCETLEEPVVASSLAFSKAGFTISRARLTKIEEISLDGLGNLKAACEILSPEPAAFRRAHKTESRGDNPMKRIDHFMFLLLIAHTFARYSSKAQHILT